MFISVNHRKLEAHGDLLDQQLRTIDYIENRLEELRQQEENSILDDLIREQIAFAKIETEHIWRRKQLLSEIYLLVKQADAEAIDNIARAKDTLVQK